MEQDQQFTKLLLLMLLYTKNRSALYIPQFQPLLHLAFWLDLVEDVSDVTEKPDRQPQIVTEHAPDICASCLHIFGTTAGGRVRSRCYMCRDFAYKDKFFSDPWPNRISQLTGYSPELLEYHLSLALKIHKETSEKSHEQEV